MPVIKKENVLRVVNEIVKNLDTSHPNYIEICKFLNSEEVFESVCGKLSKKVKKVKSTKPKKNKSAYIFFCTETRLKIKEESPDMTPTQITSRLADIWKRAKDSEGCKKFFEMAEKDKERYAEEMKSYVPTPEEIDAKTEKKAEKERIKAEKKAEKERVKALKKAEKERVKAEKKAKKEEKLRKKALKDKKPKKAKTSYLLFCDKYRAGLKEKYPEKEMKEITGMLAKLWKEIKDTDKVIEFKQLALQDKERYLKEMEIYEKEEAVKSVEVDKEDSDTEREFDTDVEDDEEKKKWVKELWTKPEGRKEW